MKIDITQIAVAIITLLSAVVTGFLIPWLKSKIGINNDKLSDNQRALLVMFIDTAVKAAEQLYNSEQGQEKKAYVLKLLSDAGYDINAESIDAAIEAAVLELHKQINE